VIKKDIEKANVGLSALRLPSDHDLLTVRLGKCVKIAIFGLGKYSLEKTKTVIHGLVNGP